jgi:hypothetical protein
VDDRAHRWLHSWIHAAGDASDNVTLEASALVLALAMESTPVQLWQSWKLPACMYFRRVERQRFSLQRGRPSNCARGESQQASFWKQKLGHDPRLGAQVRSS